MISLIGLQLDIDGVKKTLTIEEAKELKRQLLDLFPEQPHYVYPNTFPPGVRTPFPVTFPDFPQSPAQPYCTPNSGPWCGTPVQFLSGTTVQ